MKANEVTPGLVEFLTSIRKITANHKIVSSLGRLMWRLLELICYLLAGVIIFFAFVYITPRVEVVKTNDITVSLSNEHTTTIVYAIRFLLIIMATFVLIPAWLIRIIRQKNKKIEKIDELVVDHLAKISVSH